MMIIHRHLVVQSLCEVVIAGIKGVNPLCKDFVEGFKFFTKPLMLSFPILAVFKIGVTQVDAVEIRYERQMNYTTKCFA
jgi:hypothetical protein